MQKHDTSDPEASAEVMMELIDNHPVAQPPSRRAASVEYYEILAERCRDRANQIREEAREDGEPID